MLSNLTPEKVEEFLGIQSYVTQGRGIGGVIKLRPEDFLTWEILADGLNAREAYESWSGLSRGIGDLVLAVMRKRRIDTIRAVILTAKKLGVKPRTISICGIKDKMSISWQFITLPSTSITSNGLKLNEIIHLLPLRYTSRKLTSKNLAKNVFEIMIRNIDGDAEEALEKMRPDQLYSIQQYVVGTKVFVTYFRSLAHDRTEVFGADIRYETDADANLRFDDTPSFIVVGNLPLVLRESVLAKYYRMGEDFVRGFQRLTGQDIPGPFCLETIIDRQQQIYTFEFSGRIVAGTNIWIPTSPYSYLQFGEQMWMGRRIAREIRELMEQGRLEEALT